MPGSTPSILQPYASEPAVHALLDACVGRLARRDDDSFQIDEMTLRHIVDWLRVALANDDPWLKNVDWQGRPKKLMKFGSVDAIVREADKAMLKAAQRLKGITLVDGDEELVEMLQDGYYVVRLLTPAALDHESAEMQHCIGNSGYDKRLGDGIHEYLSLRDLSGHSHVTMEIESNRVIQFQGKQNTRPVDKYRDLLLPFIKSQKWHVDIPSYMFGYVRDTDGNWHPIHDLPENLEIAGDFDLRGNLIENLPNGLKVRGNLFLVGTPLETLPDGLEVTGSLILNGGAISSLPNGLKVGGNLELHGASITSIPRDLQVDGTLLLDDTPITSLPEGLYINSHLYLRCSLITNLPKGLVVGGTLALSDSPIVELPEGLKVNGSLDIENTKITRLPEDIVIGGFLYLNGSLITTLPKSFQDHDVIYDDLQPIKVFDFRKSRVNMRQNDFHP